MFVTKVVRDTVDFRLDHPIELLVRQDALHAIYKLPQLRLRIRIVKAGHRLQMLDRLELLQRLPADTL